MNREMLIQHLEEAELHVLQGEQIISRQREILSILLLDGLSTRDAEAILVTLEQSQALHVADRDKLRAALEKSPSS